MPIPFRNKRIQLKSHFLTEIMYIQEGIGYVPILEDLVAHGFSWGKKAGNMSYSFGNKMEVTKRIKCFSEKLNLGSAKNFICILPEQGEKIIFLKNNLLQSLKTTPSGGYIKCDTLFTNLKNISLMIKAADCTVSIITGLTRNDLRIAGIIHAGTKGLDRFLPFRSIKYLVEKCEVKLKSIAIGIVPSITIENYFIRDIAELSNPQEWRGFYQKRKGFYYLNFLHFLMYQYNLAGIESKQIQAYNVDTYDAASREESFSHRYWQINREVPNGRFRCAVKL